MVNTEAFSKRLQKIMEYYELSASSFSDKIEVGRSSISHILSGRNKPSLEFVMKIVKTFPEVELYWLLNGKGNFPKTEQEAVPPTPSATTQKDLGAKQISQSESSTPKNQQEVFNFENIPGNLKRTDTAHTTTQSKKEIKKVIIFYQDGTFEAFENGN